MYEVRRSFPAARPVRVGDVVDAGEWRNRALLERQGYIVPVEGKTNANALANETPEKKAPPQAADTEKEPETAKPEKEKAATPPKQVENSKPSAKSKK